MHPTSKFGEMQVDGDRVSEFNEKPTQVQGFVSGGFFISSGRSSTTTSTTREDLFLEHAPLGRLARDGQLTVNRHEGFWAAMDTYKDYQQLNNLWNVDPWLPNTGARS